MLDRILLLKLAQQGLDRTMRDWLRGEDVVRYLTRSGLSVFPKELHDAGLHPTHLNVVVLQAGLRMSLTMVNALIIIYHGQRRFAKDFFCCRFPFHATQNG